MPETPIRGDEFLIRPRSAARALWPAATGTVVGAAETVRRLRRSPGRMGRRFRQAEHTLRRAGDWVDTQVRREFDDPDAAPVTRRQEESPAVRLGETVAPRSRGEQEDEPEDARQATGTPGAPEAPPAVSVTDLLAEAAGPADGATTLRRREGERQTRMRGLIEDQRRHLAAAGRRLQMAQESGDEAEIAQAAAMFEELQGVVRGFEEGARPRPVGWAQMSDSRRGMVTYDGERHFFDDVGRHVPDFQPEGAIVRDADGNVALTGRTGVARGRGPSLEERRGQLVERRRRERGLELGPENPPPVAFDDADFSGARPPQQPQRPPAARQVLRPHFRQVNAHAARPFADF